MNSIKINQNLVIGHIDNLDLSNLPDFTMSSFMQNGPCLIGYINHYSSLNHYAFVLTNYFRIDEFDLGTLMELYLDTNDWIDKSPISENKWIVFEFERQENKKRHCAINARYLSITPEDYSLCKMYQQTYPKITGTVHNKHIDIDIQEAINETFYATNIGRNIILEELYARKSFNCSEWEQYFSHISDTEKNLFVLDEGRIEPNAALRFCLYKNLGKVELLKHPCVISSISQQDTKAFNATLKCFYNDEDTNEWIYYALNCSIADDAFKIGLFTAIKTLDIYNSINDKSALIKRLENIGPDETKEFLLFCKKHFGNDTLNKITDEITLEGLANALKLMDNDDRYQLVSSISEERGTKLVTENFRDTKLFWTYIGDKWNSLKSDIPYIAFDLESDGTIINRISYRRQYANIQW